MEFYHLCTGCSKIHQLGGLILKKSRSQQKLPLKFCGYRWLENVPGLERGIEIWTDINKYVHNVENNNLPKVNNKSFHNIAGAVKDELMLIKLNFFSAVAKLLLPFLEIYQSDKPLVPFFVNDML
ncbi:hypothetical protein AVEN_195460-1 [Araneus ventricosus]|uniref:Uncharacterized protein n=1 Tax=Araneus ventricosus TaxID=182803 RepID=A0A4Y2SI66_ARAVE|nr:hypothetical protein AVEN_195460-1 [Araneus ventricosus]